MILSEIITGINIFQGKHVLNPHQNYTVKLQWLEHLLDYEKLFKTGVVGANEG